MKIIKLTPSLLVFTALLFSINTPLFSQIENENKMQSVNKDDFLIDAYIGYPNWGSYSTEVNFMLENATDLKTGGFTGAGIGMSIFLSNQISFTFEGYYNSWNGSYRQLGVGFDDNNNPVTINHNYEFDIERFRFLLGLNYHFDQLNVEKLDLYMGFAIGTNKIWDNKESTDSNYNLRDFGYYLDEDILLDTPISARLRLGGRYFLSNNVALKFEAGLGGATMSAGLSVKL